MDTQTQLRLARMVAPPGTDSTGQRREPVQIIAVGSCNGVMIVTGDTMRETVPWDKITDMGALAEIYATLQVWQFQVAVELMGEIHRLRNLFPVA